MSKIKQQEIEARARLFNDSTLIARWTCTEEEWKRFLKSEWKRRLRESFFTGTIILFILAALILIIGTIHEWSEALLMIPYALTFSLAVLILHSLFNTLRIRDLSRGTTREVAVYPMGVIVNEFLLSWSQELIYGRTLKTSFEAVSKTENPARLKFSYAYRVHRPPKSIAHFFVPIAQGAEQSVSKVLASLR